MYTLDQIRAMRREVNRLGLAGRDVLDKYRDAELRKLCNGIGPDFFPEWARELVTDLRPESELPAFIHDVEWYESDGTREHFTATNDRFAANGKLVAQARYRWYATVRHSAGRSIANARKNERKTNDGRLDALGRNVASRVDRLRNARSAARRAASCALCGLQPADGRAPGRHRRTGPARPPPRLENFRVE